MCVQRMLPRCNLWDTRVVIKDMEHQNIVISAEIPAKKA
jgi:hypothetical protein